ncbi:hypothetical protein Hypma_008179 [Hypsizygus marmoreus]|uniref:Uncharacterized protein n=1 Tax=Hypsizygus marmoreus TaxID=39966 RepID=A0A369K158_HYPMA|nr:hypothetical protein Hypma_008179 [Hypsizygus marmoreus]
MLFACYAHYYYAQIIKRNCFNLSSETFTSILLMGDRLLPVANYHYATAYDIRPQNSDGMIYRRITDLCLIMTDEIALLRIGDKITDAPHRLGMVFEIRDVGDKDYKKVLVWFQVDNSRAITRRLLYYFVPSCLVDTGEEPVRMSGETLVG